MSSSWSFKEHLKQTTYMGMILARDEPFLKLTAVLAPANREMIAYVEILKLGLKLKKKNLSPEEMLEQFVIRSLQLLGMAGWNRDIITDLALKMGKQDESGDASAPRSISARTSGRA